MKTQKYISLAKFIVNPDEGKIWVNAPDCILRVQGTQFVNKKEKFSMIDINGGKAFMMDEIPNYKNDSINDFIEKILSQIVYNNLTDEDMQRILSYTTSICDMER